jgi:hypothetical protein
VVTLTFENEIVKITPTGTFTSLYKYQENEQPYAITKIHIITENPPSGSSSENGGIPGFPLEAMFIGFVIIMIFRLRKYSG